jgi:peptidoglycan-associated lipoprotein
MTKIRGIDRVGRVIAVLTMALLVAACSSRSDRDALEGLPVLGAAGAGAGSAQDFVVNVGDRVFFTTDSAELTSEARATLDKQAAWLTRYQNVSIMIEGHADERGTREYNIALGARRATVTQNYLVSRGVAVSRISTISYGKERPVAVCNDISCWSQNRRAVTVVQER